MGKLQRTRGAVYEREVCDVLTKKFGTKVTRKLGQARDGGDDIEVGNLRIECKRRRGIAVYDWLSQVQAAAKDCDKLPVVVARADGKRSIAILDFEDFLALIPDEEPYPQNPLAKRQVAAAKPSRPVAARGRPRTVEVGDVVETLLEGTGIQSGASARNDERLKRKSAVGAQTAAMGGSGRISIGKMVSKIGQGAMSAVSGNGSSA